MLVLADAIVTTLTGKLGVDPALNPFRDLLGFLEGVIVSPTPITSALKGDGLVRAGRGLLLFGLSHWLDKIQYAQKIEKSKLKTNFIRLKPII
jgi:hypothetical protein